jgi:hypothetical protein
MHISSWQDRLLRGKYVKIGGRPYDWVRAGLKRTVGLNLFSAHKELFWVRFPQRLGPEKKVSK